MTGQWTIRGVPDSLRDDAWWLAEPSEGPARPGDASFWTRAQPLWKVMLALVLLVCLADLSFWRVESGLSIAVFCLALSVAMLFFRPGGATIREWMLALGFAVLCNLPVIEQVQGLSIVFSFAGLLILLAWVAAGRVPGLGHTARALVWACCDGIAAMPVQTIRAARANHGGVGYQGLLRSALLPAGIGLVFAALFVNANPIFGGVLNDLTAFGWLSIDGVLRILFWGFVACLIWPYLNAQGVNGVEPFGAARFRTPTLPATLTELVNARSVTLSLILFNILFLGQTLSDLGVLLGTVGLPEGVTYAQYAHSGVYPLMAAALLAGLFAMATRSMVQDNRTLRWMVYAWLAQTLFLVMTAALRMMLYVQVYSLTYLRVAVFIWLAVVLIGLVLVIVQIAERRSTGWLIRSTFGVGIVTLYVCCFVNFAHLIVSYNLNADIPLSRLDLAYLCGLGEQAIPAMMDQGQVMDEVVCGTGGRPAIRFDPIETWQEWGFRRWRLQSYLAAHHDL